MGGIPWTSKACKHCKSSKVKCDLQDPQCGRCVRKGLQCPGYEDRPFIVKTFKPADLREISRKRASRRAMARMRPTKISQAINPGPAKCVQISSTYINLWFPMDTPQISGIDMWFGKNTWYRIFTHIQQIPDKSQMLERAIIAISLVCLGKLNHDEILVEQGVWWYNSSIRHLLQMIQRNHLSEEIIFATVIFQMLEVWYSPYGMGAFVAHINGTNACIKKLTGAQASAPVMKLLTRDQRRLSIMALTLADDMKHLAQDGQPSEDDTLLDELFHFMAPVANLVFESNTIESSHLQAAKRILSATHDYREEILSWYARRKHSIGLPYHSPSQSPSTDQTTSNHLFGTPYSFPNFESAALHVIYWTALILIEELIYKTRTIISPSHDCQEPTDHAAQFIGHAMSEFYADEICRSVPYCLSGASGAWGMGTLIGCFSQIVRPYIALRRKEKLGYCIDIYQIAVNNGMGLATAILDYVLGMWESYSPHKVASPPEVKEQSGNLKSVPVSTRAQVTT